MATGIYFPRVNETPPQEHSRYSPAVKCCGFIYGWSTDAHFLDGKLKITCRKCKKIHFKLTTKDWSPIE